MGNLTRIRITTEQSNVVIDLLKEALRLPESGYRLPDV